MKINLFVLCFVLVFYSCQSVKKTTVTLETGISKELATYRKSQVSAVSYDLAFAIPKEKEIPILSHLVLNLNLTNTQQSLYLDFNEKKENLKSVVVNGKTVAIIHEKEHLIIAKEFLVKGKNRVEVDFIAGELSLNRNDDFLYTLLVPDRASTLFPCFDQPDIKATYTLSITAPKGWSVLAGAPLINKIEKGDFEQYQFGKSDSMSTYLFSFVAGEFKSISQNLDNFPMTMLYRESNTEKISESTDAIFTLHRQAISFLEKYTQHPFPFQKMDFATIPVFQYGGMEHVGAIQYRESKLFLDNSATDSEKLSRGKLIAHESSHMWFGDLVTMKWFNDVWMKEVFANFMADKIMNPAFPKINHKLQFLATHYSSAYDEDRTKGTHPIRQNLANLKDAGSLYGNIIYNKAPIMMRQLEATMGKEVFQKGIQKYIQKYANSNADWENLVAILDKETPIDIKKWSDVWVNQSGRALFKDQIEYGETGEIKNFLIEQQAEDGSQNVWPQIFEIGLIYPDTIKTIKVNVKDRITNVAEAIGMIKPVSIIYNYDGLGYGVFPVDTKNIDAIQNTKDEVARAYSYINVYETTLIGKIKPLIAFDSFSKAIAVEENELIVKLLSNQLSTLFWDFLTVKQQYKAQVELEAIIYNRLQADLPSNIKKTLFGLFENVAYSKSGKEKLYQIWNKEVNIPNLKLNENDYTNLAMDLAIYQHDKSDVILYKTRQAITSSDKQKRFDFLLPSLSNDVTVRDSFMQSLKLQKNREKEAWVQIALANIHHPLRQDSSKKYLKECLDLIEEIQLSGDIFFPKGWLVNSVGKYSSVEAFQIVSDFLKQNPNFSPILKRKLLQATDNLARAQEIKKEIE
ncbi:M1 family aminopeptidase [Flavobacterium sp. GP15]|uniref:M1 family metallopeptidase n=1 Tax=Flavobacterium sp. GP15 TaxID=2758567 RepID=UPI00165E7307|nr:M1 family aminopeptidase [Flavobacterium sp. GP15]